MREVEYYKAMLRASRDNEIVVVTSFLTAVECTHVTDKEDKKILTDEVKRLFDSVILSGLEGVNPIFPTHDIIKMARDLNWIHEITCKPYDRLHLATALMKECVEFITTDTNSIDRDGNIKKLENLGLKIIDPLKTKVLPKKYLENQTELFNG